MVRKNSLLKIILICLVGGAVLCTMHRLLPANHATPEVDAEKRPGEGDDDMTEKQGTHTRANRLIRETSPYLLQHAHNPVDWYPWGAEAFEKARAEDRPVFLSIGYSTCHWCHVMERESFEDPATAEVLNAHFVAIKVDREERPDVDATYMKAVQMMIGSGGWPLSVFLTPEGRPFYGGTYFPPRSMYGRPSFTQVLEAIAEAWRADRSELLESSERITAALGQTPGTADSAEPSLDFLKAGYEALASDFDEAFGGFGGAPKFPQPTTLMLLLTYWYRTGESRALKMVEKTLDAMARGGIHDHLGGGFHRYSTDAKWLVPHFEKMLHDQALLSKVYVQAHQITGRDDYADVARDVFDYVLRDMTDPQGGFYAAEDADSEGEEGTFYAWKRGEIERVLGTDEARAFCAYYGVTKGGNFEGKTNVLEIVTSIEELARRYERPRERIERDLARAIEQLYERRSARPRPHKDDKVITAWNGLMISSLARGGAVLDESQYVTAAEKAAEFVLGSLRPGNRLMRYYRAGHAREKAFLEDYAFMTQGLMDLYEATFDARWLREAQVLAEQMIDLFGDEKGGGFYMTGRDAERLISRDKPSYDGAVPSGNSIAALTLLKLGRALMNERFTAVGERALHRFSAIMSAAPTSLTAMLLALDYNAGPAQEIVIATGEADRDGQTLAREVRRHFLPRATTLMRFFGDRGRALLEAVPFTEVLVPIDGATAAYVCENYACRQPVTTAEALRRILVDFPGRD